MGLKSFSRQTLRNKSATAGIQGGTALPAIKAIVVCDSNYNDLDDTALNPAGGYAKIVGVNFEAGSIVYFNGTVLTTTFISSREIRIETPAITVGSYNLMMFNLSTGSGAIFLNLAVSNFPTITTSGAQVLDQEYETKPISASIGATGDGPITYSIVPGEGNLPDGITLSSDGTLSGNAPIVSATTTYTFVVQAKDAQKQDATRQFSLTVVVDVVDWVSPNDGATISAYEYTAFSPTSLSATSRAGYDVTYASNTLPEGLSVSGNTIVGTSNTAGTTNVAIVATSNTTNKTATRNVSVVVNPDVVSWSTPVNNAVISAYEYTAFSPTELAATSAAGFGVTYDADSLPDGLSVVNNFITGTSNTTGTTNTTLTATANTTNRNSTRTVQFTVNPDVVTWSAPTPGSVFTAYEYTAFANVSLSATSAAGFDVSYAANGLPTGMSLTGSTISGTVNAVGTTNVVLTATADTTNRFANADVQFVVNQDVITWSTPSSDTSLSVSVDQPISNITLAATSAAGFDVAYVANGLPTGVTYANGVISGTPTVGGETANTTLVATAATTGRTSTRYIAWSINISGDSFWRNVSLLLSADATVAPATFVDDNSPNKYNVSPQGAGAVRSADANPYQDGYYSVEYGGTSNSFISIPHNSNLSIMSGSSNTFVAECWVYWNAVNANMTIMDKSGRNSVSFQNWAVELNASKQIRLVWGASGTPGASGIGILQTTTVPVTHRWYHIAFVKSNADWALFVDGTRITNYSGLNTANDANPSALRIGYGIQGEAGGGYMNGFISNVRVYNGPAGSAPYAATSTTITPPTTPALPGDNVYAVVCNSNRFKDSSATNATITGGSTTKISAVSPFVAPTNTYGSGYFNGISSYITVPDSAALRLGSGDFTIEFWINLATTTGQSTIIAHRASDITNGPLAIFRPSGTANLVLYLATGATGWDIFSGTTIGAVNVGQWTHVSICRSGQTFYRSINGVVSTLGTSASSVGDGSSLWSIGGDLNNNYTTGHISDVRVVKGTALYTTSFPSSLPTAPLPAVSGTSLLTLQNNGPHNNSTFKDDSGFNNIVTRSGNPTQGTFGPYGQNWSTFYPPAAYTTIAASPFTFGAGASFTVEAWINITSLPNASGYYFSVFGSCNQATLLYWLCGIDVNGKMAIQWYDGNTKVATSTTALALNTWHHVVFVASGGSLRMFLNGNMETLTGTTTLTNPTGNASYTTGSERGNRAAGAYVSNLRISNTALYSENFIVPTSPYSSNSSIGYLTSQSNRFVDNSTNDRAITVSNALIQKFSPFNTYTTSSPNTAISYNTSTFGGSIFFDGTGDYLQTANNLPHTDITQSDYTVEAWVYNMGAGAERYIFSQRGASSGWEMRINANNSVSTFFTSGTTFTSNTAVPANAWTHIAASRSGTTIRMFINGKAVLVPSTQSNGTSAHAAYGLMLGWSTSGGGLMLGHIADARVIKGRALYTANFTPPTAPLEATNDTTMLFAGRGGVVDASRMVDIETVGDVISTKSVAPFNGARSYYFDGDVDYMTASTGTGTINFGTGNFTIETWVYFTASNGTYNPFIRVNGGSQLDFGFDFSTNQLKYSTSVAVLANSWTPSIGTWYHVALVRSAGNAKIYVNGVNMSGAGVADSFDHSLNAIATLYRIGGSDFSGGHVLKGYLSDFRITKGIARSIAVPSSAQPTK